MSTRETSLTPALPAQGLRVHLGSRFMPVVFLVLASFALLPYAPLFRALPDSLFGSALYIGSRILSGQVLYRDIFESAPPLVFYFNALGLALTGGNPWGAWLISVLSLWAAALCLYAFLRHYFGALSSSLAIASLLLNLVVLLNNTGIIPELYGLLFQALILILLMRADLQPASRVYPFAIGLTLALSFLLRQTLIGLGILAGGYILLRALRSRSSRRWTDLLWMALGVGSVSTAWVIYLISNRALTDFVDQVIGYGFLSSGIPTVERVAAGQWLFSNLFALPHFYILGLVTWLAVVPFLLLNDARFRDQVTHPGLGAPMLFAGLAVLFNALYSDAARRLFTFEELSAYRWGLIVIGLLVCLLAGLILTGWFRRCLIARLQRLGPVEESKLLLPLAIALLDLPLELLLFSVPGRTDFYLALPLLPGLTILLAFLLWALLPESLGITVRWYPALFLPFILILPAIWFGFGNTFAAAMRPSIPEDQQLIADLKTSLRPGQTVLQWGAELPLYWLLEQDPPARYLDQKPLFARAYTSPERIREYTEAIKAARPDYLVDTFSWQTPLLYVENKAQCDDLLSTELQAYLTNRLYVMKIQEFPKGEPDVPVAMGELYRWICQNYEPAGTYGKIPMTVYRLSPSQP